VPKYDKKTVPKFIPIRTHKYVAKYVQIRRERIGTYFLLIRTIYGQELPLMAPPSGADEEDSSKGACTGAGAAISAVSSQSLERQITSTTGESSEQRKAE
jgi:hypothetical protein